MKAHTRCNHDEMLKYILYYSMKTCLLNIAFFLSRNLFYHSSSILEFRLDKNKWGKLSLLLTWCAPDKVQYQSLKFDCKCYITPFFFCVITIWRCYVLFSHSLLSLANEKVNYAIPHFPFSTPWSVMMIWPSFYIHFGLWTGVDSEKGADITVGWLSVSLSSCFYCV